MKKNACVLGMVAVAGLALPAMAQDSVSNTPGLPGDAIAVDVAGAPNQKSAYVVDLVPLFTSWNTKFGIAPIIKGSTVTGAYRGSAHPSGTFFNAQLSAQSISQTLGRNVPYASSLYRHWNDDAGQGSGINPEQNAPTNVTEPSGLSNQFGVVFADFGTTPAATSASTVISGLVNYNPNDPGRLWVTRVVSAGNFLTGQGDRSQFGIGAIDSHGNTYIRADSFNSTHANKITGNNYFRVRADQNGAFAGRDPAMLNVIDIAGGSDAPATDWIVRLHATSHNTPNGIPSELTTSPRGAVIGSNFNRNYVYESTPLTPLETTTHRPGTGDHRGGVGFSPLKLRGLATVGTAAMITKTSLVIANGQPTDAISMWGVDGVGLPVNPVTIQLPRAVTTTLPDPAAYTTAPQQYDWDLGNGTSVGDFRHYSSQVFARGGNGQVAIGRDQAGRGLLAAEVSGGQSMTAGVPPVPTDDSGHNAIAVYRFDPANAAGGSWIVAAWTNPAGSFTGASGKEIYGDNGNDGIPFSADAGEFDGVVDLNPLSPTYDGPIGRLCWAAERTGGSIIGPSISAPTFDSVGNIYFLATAALYKSTGIDYDNVLIRAIYDPTTFSYKLDLMLELGKTFLGANSGLRYQMQFMSVSTSGSRPTSASIWSDNATGQAWNDMDPTTLDIQDPRTLGGLVLSASIVYDRNNDGLFENPASTGGNPASPDQQYNALMYIGYMGSAPQGCPADFDGDGTVDFFDYDAFVICFEDPDCTQADFDGDGTVDFFDYDAFVVAFETPCP
ncbi:MAG: hypothetical protein AABZ53_15250 [Planctomycetota bacterium]